MLRPTAAAERRPRQRLSLLATSLLVLVALLVPTVVVFSVMHKLPDGRRGFTTRDLKKEQQSGASGGGRVAGRAGARLAEQMFGGDSDQARGEPAHVHAKAAKLQGARHKRAPEIGGAIIRHNAKRSLDPQSADSGSGSGDEGSDGVQQGRGAAHQWGQADNAGEHGSSGSGGGSGGRSGVRTKGGGSRGQRHGRSRPSSPPLVGVEGWREEGAEVGVHEAQQTTKHAQQQQMQRVGLEQARDDQQAEQQAQAHDIQQAQQGQQGQQTGQQALQTGQNAGQQQQQRAVQAGQQLVKADRAGQQQQQRAQGQQQARLPQLVMDPVKAEGPRWNNTLLHAAGRALPRPNCADLSPTKQCQEWAAMGECDSRPGFMYASCAAACGVCSTRYLHGDEVAREVDLVPGVRMPMVGYGTAGLTDLTADAAFTAIRIGYRLVDSAGAREWYREDLVGWGWSASGIKREHLFITSKIHPRHHGYWNVLEVFAEALQDLQTDYVDLMLLHYPECWGDLCGDAKPEGTWKDSWAALEQLVAEKKLRAAGVSNFNLDQMNELVAMAHIKPAVLQANSDLLRQNWELQVFCRRHGIQFQAYSSLGGQWLVQTQGAWNPVVDHPLVMQIAQQHGKTAGQVALRWALQHGQAVLPRTTKVVRMEENLALFDFDLTDAEMQRLDALDGTQPLAPGQAGQAQVQAQVQAQQAQANSEESTGQQVQQERGNVVQQARAEEVQAQQQTQQLVPAKQQQEAGAGGARGGAAAGLNKGGAVEGVTLQQRRRQLARDV